MVVASILFFLSSFFSLKIDPKMMIVLRLQVEYDYVPAVPLPPDDVGDAAVVLGPVQRRPVAESLTLVPGHHQH